jgi:hypothetical protein
MVTVLLAIVSDRPNLLTVFPSGCAADHNMLLNEASDHLSGARYSPDFVVRKLVTGVNDQIPPAGQYASTEGSLAVFLSNVLQAEILQHRLTRFAANCKPR